MQYSPSTSTMPVGHADAPSAPSAGAPWTATAGAPVAARRPADVTVLHSALRSTLASALRCVGIFAVSPFGVTARGDRLFEGRPGGDRQHRGGEDHCESALDHPTFPYTTIVAGAVRACKFRETGGQESRRESEGMRLRRSNFRTRTYRVLPGRGSRLRPASLALGSIAQERNEAHAHQPLAPESRVVPTRADPSPAFELLIAAARPPE